MKAIPLTRNYVAIIDAEDAPNVERYNWHVHISKGKGKQPGQPYARANINGRKVYLHRFITGAELPWQVDHGNHQTLDCRRSNLEVKSHIENQQTRRNVKAHRARLLAADGKGMVRRDKNPDAPNDKGG